MDRKKSISVRHLSASLMMPISDPHDRFLYPHHTPMKDTYILPYVTEFVVLLAVLKNSVLPIG